MDFQQKVHDPTTRDRAVAELDRTLVRFLHDADDRRKWRRYILKHASEDVVDSDPKPVERMLSLFRALRQQGYLTEPPNPDVEECRPTKSPTGKSRFRLTNRRLTKDDVDRLGAFNGTAASRVGVSASQPACVPDQEASSWIDRNLIRWFPMTCPECSEVRVVYYAKQETDFCYCRTCWISWICSYTTQKPTRAAVLDGGRDWRRGGDDPAEAWVAETLAFVSPGRCGVCGNCEGVYVAFENQRREGGFCMPCWVKFYDAWDPEGGSQA